MHAFGKELTGGFQRLEENITVITIMHKNKAPHSYDVSSLGSQSTALHPPSPEFWASRFQAGMAHAHPSLSEVFEVEGRIGRSGVVNSKHHGSRPALRILLHPAGMEHVSVSTGQNPDATLPGPVASSRSPAMGGFGCRHIQAPD